MVIVVPEFKIVKGQIVFLAGPIQGAEDWQARAIDLISKANHKLNIATPRGNYANMNFDYDLQVKWESHYLARASRSGAILFWLAKEKVHYCERSYAQTTRSELGEWRTMAKINPLIKLFVGIEPGFTGERYQRAKLEEDCPNVKIHKTLEDLCRDVVQALS